MINKSYNPSPVTLPDKTSLASGGCNGTYSFKNANNKKTNT